MANPFRPSLKTLMPALLLAAATLSAPASAAPMDRQAAYGRAAALATLGQALFFDPSLSASGHLSCAGCHDPAHAFGPANAQAIQRGGSAMDQAAGRAAPTLTYLQAVPQFTQHFFDSPEEGDESIDAGPTGGLTWDGRVDRRRDQVRIPLLSPVEMANASIADVVAKAAQAPYAEQIRALAGPRVFENAPEQAFAVIAEALETFQQTPALFYRYDSKYDAFLADRAQLSQQEQHGFELFVDEDKGNCASCHPVTAGSDGSAPQFSDWGFIALGLPRNPDIPANADAGYFDLGLCGPDRRDFAGLAEYCGLFRTPSLRNVATKQSFFHNGVVHSLRQAVAFYAERDTLPEKWYPRRPDGGIAKFDDLPAQYHDNVETEAPFGRDSAGKPRLSESDIDDIVAFLRTLTDGFSPPRDEF